MTQLHAREKTPLSLDRHGNLILPAKVEKKVELPKPKAKAPAKKKAASKKKAKK